METRNIIFLGFAFSMNKFKDLVFTFRFLWLHSLFLLLSSLKLFLFLPTSSGGSCRVGLKGYSFFSRISGGKWRWRNGYKQRYEAFEKLDINNRDGTMTLGLTSIYVSGELISHTGTAYHLLHLIWIFFFHTLYQINIITLGWFF